VIRTAIRCAAKSHRCGNCGSFIYRGDDYVELVMSPSHGDVGNTRWWRLTECSDCARQYGRMEADL